MPSPREVRYIEAQDPLSGFGPKVYEWVDPERRRRVDLAVTAHYQYYHFNGFISKS